MDDLEFLQTHSVRLMDIAERSEDSRTKVELAVLVQEVIARMEGLKSSVVTRRQRRQMG
jgi:hypothetical protein